MGKKYVKKRCFVLTATYLSAAAIVLGVLAGTYYEKSKQYERFTANNYQHAFGELVTAVGEMDSALQKSVYATSPGMVSAVCTEVFGKAMTAQMSLGALPFGAQELEQTSGFISRVGDYAFSLSRSAAAGNGYTPEQRDNLKKLSETASILSENLKGLQTDLQAGRLSLMQLQRSERTLQVEGEDGTGYMGDSISLIEQEFPEVPSLIYDGPFSEHLQGLVPKMLENAEEVSEEKARENAAAFLNVNKARVYTVGECGGDVPCYSFGTDSDGGGSSFVSVTKAGGKVMNMISSRPVGSENISVEDALSRAERFLRSAGYTDMAETYHMTQGGVLTVNYAYRQGDVLCYSDLVKVSVALDNGRIYGFEAKGYLTAHCERDLPAPAIGADEARQHVPAELEVLSEQLALVPSDGKYEVLCHEFKCAAEDERHYIIYVNALTGAQEKILILLEDDSGALTL